MCANFFNLSHRLCRRAKQTKTDADNANYRLARRKAKKAWFAAQQKQNSVTYAKAMGPGGRSKAFWKILKQNFGDTKNQSIPTLVDGPNSFISDISKATILNSYFVEQSTLDLSIEPQLPVFLPQRDLKTNVPINQITISPAKVFFCAEFTRR